MGIHHRSNRVMAGSNDWRSGGKWSLNVNNKPARLQSHLQVDYVRPQDLVPYANNPRQHSKSQLKKIVASLRAYGFVNPILTDEHGNVLCGHGRLQAAIIAGFEQVPTIKLPDMTEADKTAYIIADNAIAEKAGWSKSLLRLEMQGLVDLGYEVELTGFESSRSTPSYLAIPRPRERLTAPK